MKKSERDKLVTGLTLASKMWLEVTQVLNPMFLFMKGLDPAATASPRPHSSPIDKQSSFLESLLIAEWIKPDCIAFMCDAIGKTVTQDQYPEYESGERQLALDPEASNTALLILVGKGWQQYKLLPYSITDRGKIEWQEPESGDNPLTQSWVVAMMNYVMKGCPGGAPRPLGVGLDDYVRVLTRRGHVFSGPAIR